MDNKVFVGLEKKVKKSLPEGDTIHEQFEIEDTVRDPKTGKTGKEHLITGFTEQGNFFVNGAISYEMASNLAALMERIVKAFDESEPAKRETYSA